MQWAAKRDLSALAILITLLISSGVFLTVESTRESQFPRHHLTCFDSESKSLRVTTAESCPGDLISLGDRELSESTTASGEVTEAHPILLARFEAARAVAAIFGVHLYITSGFRSEERQGELFANAIEKYGSETEAAKWVLPPQYSHHPQGLALDINYPGDRAGAEWLDREGSRFGLCRVYANEWWHFEGVIAPGEKCPAMAANALVDMPN